MALEGIVFPAIQPGQAPEQLPQPGYQGLLPFPKQNVQKLQITATDGSVVTLEKPKVAEIVDG